MAETSPKLVPNFTPPETLSRALSMARSAAVLKLLPASRSTVLPLMSMAFGASNVDPAPRFTIELRRVVREGR